MADLEKKFFFTEKKMFENFFLFSRRIRQKYNFFDFFEKKNFSKIFRKKIFFWSPGVISKATLTKNHTRRRGSRPIDFLRQNRQNCVIFWQNLGKFDYFCILPGDDRILRVENRPDLGVLDFQFFRFIKKF